MPSLAFGPFLTIEGLNTNSNFNAEKEELSVNLAAGVRQMQHWITVYREATSCFF